MSFASPKTLYLATGNPGKLREFRHAAAAKGISVEALPHFATLPPCIEDGETFLANAQKKALHYSKFTTGLVFADDSGICVDALGGAPGVYSARYSGPGATDTANNALLLSELKNARAKDRSAHYVCVIVLACNKKVLGKFEGRADGVIIEAPRGSGGISHTSRFSPDLR